MSTLATAMRERRDAVVASMDALAAPAARAGRHFTTDEDDRWTALTADLAEIDQRIAELADQDQRSAAAA